MGRNTRRPRHKEPAGNSGEREHRLAEGDGGPEERSTRGLTPWLLHRDENLLILSKPAGLPVDREESDLPSVFDYLVLSGEAAEDEPLATPYPLDWDASGVLLVARGADILDRLERQIAAGCLELRYLVLVRGRPPQESGTINSPLLDPGRGGGSVRLRREGGRAATTEWRLRELYVGFALLECIPRSAVRSQIRVHLQAAGMPLVVDPRYGGGAELLLSSFKVGYRPSRRREERPLIARPTLHAQSVRLEHPVSGQQMLFEATLPKDMRAAIHQLDRFGRVPSGGQ